VVAGAGGGQPTERLRRTVASVVGVAARRAGQGAAGAGAGAAAVKFGQTRFGGDFAGNCCIVSIFAGNRCR
jgi:hypothetical protein